MQTQFKHSGFDPEPATPDPAWSRPRPAATQDHGIGIEELNACFLGPYGENDGLLEHMVVEFLRDHVYWRRNFHPEDPPAIPTSAASSLTLLGL